MEASVQHTHCCDEMAVHLKSECNGISYSLRFREYRIVRPMPDTVVGTAAEYCPWCGVKLPASLREEYFRRLSKRGLDIDILTPLSELPEEFRDSRWWNVLSP